MNLIHGFEMMREEALPDLKSIGRFYRHAKTGAEFLSIINDDENKTFVITFRTPPEDSTGIAHILEHSVLCGSRKYPLKEPFIELVKGSLNTFLNAMTGSAETYYPVASLNERDFYNLVDVYLDSVFYPALTPHILEQEGWHYELVDKSDPIIYKGVVFNEMKGAYQSPDTVLHDYAERSLFPGHVYGLSSGGDPKHIPDLTFEQLDAFHKKYYHPSNARIWFWGDDDPEQRLRLLDGYLSEFESRAVDSEVPRAPAFSSPRRLVYPFAVGSPGDDTEPTPPGKGEQKGAQAKAMMSMNWVLTDRVDFEFDLAMEMLQHILTGTPASPLRKALIDSGMVEHVGAGVSELRQRAFRMGLKGLDAANADAVEKLVLSTLDELATAGISPDAVEAAVNTAEFSLRELNTGGVPRGLMVAFYSLSTWLYGEDPFGPLRFEGPLAAIKAGIAAEPTGYFETMIRNHFLENMHRTTVVYTPDPGLAEREAAEERGRLRTVQSAMSPADVERVINDTRMLQQMQQTPDSEEALAKLPRLTLADLDPNIKKTPTAAPDGIACRTYYHDLFTNGVVYLDLGFDLRVLPANLLPYLSLFGRALLQMGTGTEDFVQLTQRIGRKTGGIQCENVVSSAHGTKECIGRLIVRAKATPSQAPDLMAILRDILLGVRLDNQSRFAQMVMEEKVRLEASVASAGHSFAARRLGARFSQAGWVGEQMGGITYLNFIRDLAERVTKNWPDVLAALEEIKARLLGRSGMIANVTLDQAAFQEFQPRLAELVDSLPTSPSPFQGEGRGEVSHFPGEGWGETLSTAHQAEGLTIPGQVNFVGKMTSLRDVGYQIHGSALVVSNLLRTSWLWEKVRVEGGAYGGFCVFDHLTGLFTFLSYRDPNLLRTIENYDGAGEHLSHLSLSDAELTRAIIGTISDLDAYQLPDAKGYAAMVRELVGETEEMRQRRRDQVLGTTVADLRAFGDMLSSAMPSGNVCVVGSADAIAKANEERPGWLTVSKVL